MQFLIILYARVFILKNKHSQKELLKGLGFTFKKAYKIVLFSMTFSSIGLGSFVFLSDHAFKQSVVEVKDKLVNSFDNIVVVFALTKEEQEKAQMIEKMDFVKFPKTKNIGPRDLNLNNTSKLVEVKAQKKVVTDNLSLIRFVDKN